MIEITIWAGFIAAIVSLIVSWTFRSFIPRDRVTLVEDPEGRGRVELIAEPQGFWPQGVVGLRFLTKKGENMLGLGMYQDEGFLTLLDKTNFALLNIQIEEGHPQIVFWKKNPDGSGTKRIVIGSKPDGMHALEFIDEAGTRRVSFGVKDNGTAVIMFYNEDGNVIWKAP